MNSSSQDLHDGQRVDAVQLPAPSHTPGPMRPLTAIEQAATAAIRFREAYRHWNDWDKFADGRTKGEAIERFNTEAHTPENVASIINDGWAYPDCSSCRKHWPVVVQLTHEWSEESYTICASCLDRAKTILDQFPDARAAIAKATGQ